MCKRREREREGEREREREREREIVYACTLVAVSGLGLTVGLLVAQVSQCVQTSGRYHQQMGCGVINMSYITAAYALQVQPKCVCLYVIQCVCPVRTYY